MLSRATLCRARTESAGRGQHKKAALPTRGNEYGCDEIAEKEKRRTGRWSFNEKRKFNRELVGHRTGKRGDFSGTGKTEAREPVIGSQKKTKKKKTKWRAQGGERKMYRGSRKVHEGGGERSKDEGTLKAKASREKEDKYLVHIERNRGEPKSSAR